MGRQPLNVTGSTGYNDAIPGSLLPCPVSKERL